MNNKQLNEHLEAIKYELAYAEKKHPKFCDCFTTMGNIKSLVAKTLEVIRASNDDKHNAQSAETILREETLEATMAYLEGDLLHCLQELAQCGAVILRTMEFVKNEMEERSE